MLIVIALGGDALLCRGDRVSAAMQRQNIAVSADAIAGIAKDHQVVVTYGNGPQLGHLAKQLADRTGATFPLDVFGRYRSPTAVPRSILRNVMVSAALGRPQVMALCVYMNENAPSSVPMTGLSDSEAQARLAREGYNELPRGDRRTAFRIVLEVLREPMLALLLGVVVVYLALGDLQEALILLLFAMGSILITVVQETRTERVLEALRDLTSPRALVIRDGVRKRIAGREVARGDLIVLSEGDRVPADAALLQAHELQADESLLTGESVPVRKLARLGTAEGAARPGGDDLPHVFSGALIVRGTGIAEVAATGALSEIGKIGQSLSTLETEPPRLQAQTRRLVRMFALVGGFVSVLAVVLYGSLRGGWLDAVLVV
jgi:magnesium-transporting ATPase (P-type)